ncbi:MAG: sodium:solute symporter, partial [Arthrobacter sp.]|nr:sodium:solute symporter [Arthrobacter sp.]
GFLGLVAFVIVVLGAIATFLLTQASERQQDNDSPANTERQVIV